MSKDFFIFLATHENAALITFRGELEGILIKNTNDFFKNADALQELMVHVMKRTSAQEGRWIWKISDRWQTISGWELDEGDEGPYELPDGMYHL